MMAKTDGADGASARTSCDAAAGNRKNSTERMGDGVLASMRQSITAMAGLGKGLTNGVALLVGGASTVGENSDNKGKPLDGLAQLPGFSAFDCGTGGGTDGGGGGGGGERVSGSEGSSGERGADVDGIDRRGTGVGGRGSGSGGDGGAGGGGGERGGGDGDGGDRSVGEVGRDGDDGGNSGGSGGSGGGGNNGDAYSSSGVIATAAGEDVNAGAGPEKNSRPCPAEQAERHLSCKYTKEELLSRHWGMNLEQMKRVKALLRIGVCEEDLEIADRLLKIGRDMSDDTPLTKEEQLLGYTVHQRQRIKALQILGLTEESFERGRAAMLSSLGPSAFGFNSDETAAWAAKAEAEEGWTPVDMFRRKGHGHQHAGGGDGGDGHHHPGVLRMPTIGGPHSTFPHIGGIGRNTSSKLSPTNRHPGCGAGSHRSGECGAATRQPPRRASDSDTGGYLPDVHATRRRARMAGGGIVAVDIPPVQAAVASGSKPPSGGSPLSSRTDPG